MILVIVLLVIAAAVAAVVIGGQKKKKTSIKDKADISSTVSAIAASYEEFLADDADASKEDRKQDAKRNLQNGWKDVSKETAEKLQKKVKSDALKKQTFMQVMRRHPCVIR